MTTRQYDGELIRVVDGDTVVLKVTKTFDLDVDFGFYIRDRVSLTKSGEVTFRIRGIDAPEMKGASLVSAKASKARLQELLIGKKLKIISHKTDKYGRWVADIEVDGTDVGTSLMESGHARVYTE